MKICQENLCEKLSTALKRSGENETKSYTYETTSDNRAFTYVYTTEVIVKNILTCMKTTIDISLTSRKLSS